MRFVKRRLTLVEKHICAIKINFHLILPLSLSQMSEINDLAHSYGLQSIADIKLNDIISTNEIAIDYLLKMGFDAVIVNPFIGKECIAICNKSGSQKNAGLLH